MANIIVKPTQILGGGSNEFKFLSEDILMSDKSTTLQTEITNIKNKINSVYTKTEVDSISQYLSSQIAQIQNDLINKYWKHTTENHGAYFNANSSLQNIVDGLGDRETTSFWVNQNTIYGQELRNTIAIQTETPMASIFGICEVTKYQNNVRLSLYQYNNSYIYIGRYTTINNVGWSRWRVVYGSGVNDA